MWERGLKLAVVGYYHAVSVVALHVGAWIETTEVVEQFVDAAVALHVGAWIETFIVLP